MRHRHHGLKVQLLLIGLLMNCMGTASAYETKPLYEIELSIAAEGGASDQPKLMTEAFKNILIRVGGTHTILESGPIIDALSNPDKYVTQFSYHQRLATERSIKVNFNKNLINQLLAKAKQPIWENPRPLTLVWLAIEKNNILSWAGNSPTPIGAEFEQLLNKRAMPYVFPLLDLTDTQDISEQNACDQSIEPLRQASKRYHPDAILVGCLKEDSALSTVRWILLKNEQQIQFEFSANETNELLSLTAESLAKNLSNMATATTATVTETQGTNHVTLTVSGIENAELYSQVLEYLRRLPAVSEVEIMQLFPEKVIFDLHTKTSNATIAKSITEDHFLTANPTLEVNGALSFTVGDKP